jgi:hypothetical protein
MARFQTRRGPPPSKSENGMSDLSDEQNPNYPPGDSLVPEEEIENENEENEFEENEIDEDDNVCVYRKYYSRYLRPRVKDSSSVTLIIFRPIEIYHCLWKPEQFAFNICLWEHRWDVNIDQCIDVHPDAPNIPENSIPGDAIYVIVGDTIMSNPYGHAALFCRRVTNPKTGYERYKPAVGFFWSFAKLRGTTVHSLTEYFHGAAQEQIVDLYERVPPEDEKRFREVYGLLTRTVNREMAALERNERILRNIIGANRGRPTRWRSVVKQKPRNEQK